MYEEAQRASGVELRKDKPGSRLSTTVRRIGELTSLVHSLCSRVSEMNNELLGTSGPPHTESARCTGEDALSSSSMGVVAQLETSISNLSHAVEELDTLINFQREMGVVA